LVYGSKVSASKNLGYNAKSIDNCLKNNPLYKDHYIYDANSDAGKELLSQHELSIIFKNKIPELITCKK
jgi:hypothetical protein